MPIFLLTATDKNGKRETHRVEAENSQEAFNKYELQGFVDIILHSDDVVAATSVLFPSNEDVDEYVSAAELVELQYLTSFEFFLFMLRKTYWKYCWVYLIIGLYLGYRWTKNSELSSLDYSLLSMLILPVVISLWVAYFSSKQKYDKLIQAFSWGRWQDVLEQAPSLRGKVPEFELTCREAVAVAALGDFDEGFEMMESIVDSSEVPRWMYLGRLSELHEVVKDYDQVMECMQLAYEEAPENPTVAIDYAYAILKYGSDLTLANELLEDAEQQSLSELVELLILYFKGLLELNLRNLRAAESLFRNCLNKLMPIAPGEPMLQLFVDLNHAYLAITLAELGETESAEGLYQLALPRLKALDEELIMERYAEAIA